MRRTEPALAESASEFLDLGNGHLFGFRPHGGERTLTAIVNLTGVRQSVSAGAIGTDVTCRDLFSGAAMIPGAGLELASYQVMWLVEP